MGNSKNKGPLNTYEVKIRGYDQPLTVQGHSAGAAKYAAYQRLDTCDSFFDFLSWVEAVRLLHRFRPSDLFGDPERFERMKERRGIPFAYIGQRVILHSGTRGDIQGTICGANHSDNLDIVFDGTSWTENCHPHYQLDYLDGTGNVIAMF